MTPTSNTSSRRAPGRLAPGAARTGCSDAPQRLHLAGLAAELREALHGAGGAGAASDQVRALRAALALVEGLRGRDGLLPHAAIALAARQARAALVPRPSVALPRTMPTGDERP